MRSPVLSPRARRRSASLVALFVGALLLQSAAAGTPPVTRSKPSDASSSRLLVKFASGVGTSARERAIASAGGRAETTITGIDVNVVEAPATSIALVKSRLRGLRTVQFVEPDALAHAFDTVPNDYWWPSQWSALKIGATRAWDLSTGSPGVVVAVLDTGIDGGHPDLQGALVAGRDIVNNDADPSDDQGHGTFAAGVVAARSNNTIGVASYCWRCSLMPVKVLGSDGSGSLSNVASGIVWATDHGARVVNMSLGGTSSSSTLASAVKYAHDRGVVLVASAGNYGTSTPVYPAAYPEVIGVAGSDSADKLYSWSSFGSWVSVAAPGFNWSTARGGGYGEFAGTSSAAPVVAALAGLAASFSPGSTNVQIESAIETTATPIGAVVSAGRVNAHATLAKLGGSTGSAPVSTADPAISGTLQGGQSVTASAGSWSGSDPLVFAYQWQRCDSVGAACAPIVGAVAPSYLVSVADVGAALRIVVSASNAYGSSSATSAATAPIATAPVAAAPPVTGTATATFSGSLNRKQPSRSFPLVVGAGTANAALAFSKSPSLSLTVSRADGTVVGSASGSSVLPLIASLDAGSYSYAVGGGSGNASFTLNITYPAP